MGQGVGHPVQQPGRGTDIRNGFDRLMRNPDLQGLIERGPKATIPKKREGNQLWMAYLVIFVIVILRQWRDRFGHLSLDHAVLPLIAFALIGAALRRKSLRVRAYPGTHLESLPCRLLELSGNEDRPGGRLKVLIEMPSGERRRLTYSPAPEGLCAVGDYGVAHIKANVLVEFRSLSVISG